MLWLQHLCAIYFLRSPQDSQCSCVTYCHQQQNAGVSPELRTSHTGVTGCADCAAGLRNQICYARMVFFYLFIVP